MAHQIVALQEKNADWKVVSILNAAGEIVENVSVNRTNKKGESFPDFDNIAVGAKIEGQMWTSPAGKQYLFAPKGKGSAPKPEPFSTGNAEIKNYLEFKIMPLLAQFHKEMVIMNERLNVALGSEKDDGFKMPNFGEEDGSEMRDANPF